MLASLSLRPLSLGSSMTSDKFLHPSEPQFLHLQSGRNANLTASCEVTKPLITGCPATPQTVGRFEQPLLSAAWDAGHVES